MLALVLLGCGSTFTPDGVDRWARAAEACATPVEPLDAACAAVLAEDFGVDADAEGALPALAWLATWDLGGDPLPDHPYVHAEAVDRFDGWPGGTRTARLYNFAAQSIDRVRLDDGAAAAAGMVALYDHGVVRILPGILGFSAVSVAPTFAHEAAHAVAPDHVPCDETACDEGWAGAYGVQAAAAELAALQGDDAWVMTLEASAADAAEHVIE